MTNKNTVAAIFALLLLAVVTAIYIDGINSNVNKASIGIIILVVVVLAGIIFRVLSELDIV